MTQSKPISVFIGSSTEGLSIAQAIQLELEGDAVCTIWYQGVFGLSEGTLESLESALSKYQFAILVLTPDDMATVSGESVQLPRDNVLFELGLFMGRLGRKHVFVVYHDDEHIKLPTDLAGITVGRFRAPHASRGLRHLSTTDLLPVIGPVVSRIRAAIHRVQEEQPPDIRVYYVAPTLTHNDFYANFQAKLEVEIAKEVHFTWQYCAPKGGTAYDTYAEVERALAQARPQDAVLLVPKDLDDPRMAELLRAILARYSMPRVVFIDQPPPGDFLLGERISFVGSDDRKVGILAALAVHEKVGAKANRTYCAISGPGGELRVKGFTDALQCLDPEAQIDTFNLGDVDRIESLPHVRHIIRSFPPDACVGLFAGNDETALGIVQLLGDEGRENVHVVGCDCTREMRLAVDGKNPAALATIDINAEGQAQKVIQAIRRRVIEFQEPRLYPVSLQAKRLLRDAAFRSLWEARP